MRAIAFALLAASCTTMNDPKDPNTTAPPSLSPGDEVRTAADRDAKSGQMVAVFGIYTEVAGGKAVDAPLDGHAAITLGDGTRIALAPPWHADAIRPADERKLAGQEVVAKGLLFAECPPPPNGGAYQKSACLERGLTVIDRATFDFLTGTD
jgi:hypothetical protein